MYARPPRYVDGLPRPDRCLVMGVVNVTPDSFSDGGQYFDTDLAVAHGRRLVAEGADLVDVGGESTRPGAVRPSLAEELDRVVPVVAALAAEGAAVSVDTMRAEVAAAAVGAGAVLVNDVSGGLADPAMYETVARLDVAYVLMHWRAHSVEMQQHTQYDDLVSDVIAELRKQLDAATAAGVRPERIVVDPGIGFSKTGEQNWEVLAATERLHELELPVLIATSRKRFLGVLLASEDGQLRPPQQRDDATVATTTLAAAAGAWCVRTHAVRAERRCRPGGPPLGGGEPAWLRRTCASATVGRSRRPTPASTPPSSPPTSTRCRRCGSTTRRRRCACTRAALPVRGTSAIELRSWALIMANTPYIQFFLTDVEVSVLGDVASVTCTENVLTAGESTASDSFGGGRRWRPTSSPAPRGAGGCGSTTRPR